MSRAVSSALAASGIVLPRLLLILVPSVPSSSGAPDSSASGTPKTGPNRSLNRRAMTRVISRCGSWSCPTGTRLALQNKMSAAWCTG